MAGEAASCKAGDVGHVGEEKEPGRTGAGDEGRAGAGQAASGDCCMFILFLTEEGCPGGIPRALNDCNYS